MRNIRFVTLALTGAMLVLATTAYAQDPFAIDGVVLDNMNSRATPLPNPGNAPKATDLSLNSKELGPKNGSPQQIGNIHTATVPMLADTNPNGNNDLNAVWIQTDRSTGDNHFWLYYGWSRDTAGTGIIGIELQKNQSPCGSTFQNFPACNPWGARSAGDVILVWDTQGGATRIVKRVFISQNGDVVLPPCPQGFPAVQNDQCREVQADAVFSDSVGDDLRGEAGIDLTAAGIAPLDQCVTFATIIPFSGTGNSDSADIKDAVLQPFPPISTCGTIKVKKVLLNLTSLQRNFSYTVDRTGGEVIKLPGTTSITGVLEGHNVEDTINDLQTGTNYRVVENTPVPSPFVKVKVFCTLGNTTYTLFDSSGQSTIVTGFPVQASQTTSCTIQNMAVGSPSATTSQSARLHDQVNLTGVLAHASLQMTATFSLWKNSSNCSTGQMSTGPNGATEISASVSFVAAQEGQTTTGFANTLATAGFGTSGDGTYYWKVVLSGDTVNSVTPFCTENTLIDFTD